MTAQEVEVGGLVIAITALDALVVSPKNGNRTPDQPSAPPVPKVSSRRFTPLVAAMAVDTGRNASGLPRFANRCQFKANLLTTTSNTLAALTGLAIWASVQASPAWWAKAAMAFAALLSAVLGFLPGIYHWGDNATKARELASEYGHLYGELLKIQGQICEGEEVSQQVIDDAQKSLEDLKKRRQDINAEWSDASDRGEPVSHVANRTP